MSSGHAGRNACACWRSLRVCSRMRSSFRTISFSADESEASAAWAQSKKCCRKRFADSSARWPRHRRFRLNSTDGAM
eukprot:15478881-Alexandrium_andersonii.AAC.1